MRVRRVLFVFGAALSLLLGPTATVEASEVQEKVAGWAKEIAQLIKDQGGTEVAVGEFTGPPAPASSSGPSIQIALIEELKKLNVGVNAKAFLVIKGEFYPPEEEDKKRDDLTIRIVAIVRNKSGKQIKELSAEINYKKGNEDIVKLLAMNVDLSKHTKADPETQNYKLKRDLGTPPLALGPTKIQVSKDSPFAVELLTRVPGGELHLVRPNVKEGHAFTEIKRGQEYVLRLHNSSKHEAAVSVTIDGVDAFQFFEPAAGRPSSFLVGAGKTRDIIGWPRNTGKVSAFLVGSFGDSAAAKALKGSASLGTITVRFHPCWEGKPPPEYNGSRSSNPNATGLGRDIGQKSRVIRRTIGPLVTAVSIRYNK